MKKLSIISNQIKSNTFSYTGKGSFEAIVNQNKEKVLEWLENLLPLQTQIEMLKESEHLDFQKRNYTRILTKLFPNEYKEFVSQNILVRDASIIAKYYDEEYNITILYDNLIRDKFLKYPGKYDKYVEFNIFQKFVMLYRDDLLKCLENTDTSNIKKSQTQESIKQDSLNENQNKKEQKEQKVDEIKEEIIQEEEILEDQKSNQKETNWTNLLLGRIK